MYSSHTLLLLLGLLLQTLFFAALAEFVLRRQGLSLRKVGLTRLTVRQTIAGIGLGIGLAIGIYGFAAVELWLFQWLLPPTAFQSLLAWTDTVSAEAAFKQLPSAWAMLLFALSGSIAAPIGEEALFRGLIYTTLKRRFRSGSVAPMLVSALLFALFHVSPLLMLPTFIMGLCFAAAYERTNSLWVPILMHSANNGIIFVALTWQLHGT